MKPTLLQGGSFNADTSRIVDGGGFVGFGFQINLSTIPRVIPGVPVYQRNEEDVVLNVYEGETVVSDWVFETVPSPGNPGGKPYTITLTPNTYLESPQGNLLMWKADGSTSLKIETDMWEVQKNIETTSQVIGYYEAFNRYGDGSLAKHICDFVDDAINGKTANSTTLPLFSTVDHVNRVYVYNTQCWLYGQVDNLTCISPAMGGSTGTLTGQRAGTFITPQCTIHAWHSNFTPFLGQVIVGVTPDNVVHERTVIARERVGTSDIGLCWLDSPMPVGIAVAKILPLDWEDYLPSYNTSEHNYKFIPAVSSNQSEILSVRNCAILQGYSSMFYPPPDPVRNAWYREAVSGDSGSPAGVVINGKFVLLCCWTGDSGGASVAARRGAIQDVIDGFSDGPKPEHQLQTIDLGLFTNFVTP